MERQDQSVASVRGRVALIHASVSYELHRRQYKDNYDHRWQSIASLLAFFRVHLRHRPYLVPSFSSAGMPQIARDSPGASSAPTPPTVIESTTMRSDLHTW